LFKAAAIWRSDEVPEARISVMMGARSAARAAAFLLRTVRLISRPWSPTAWRLPQLPPSLTPRALAAASAFCVNSPKNDDPSLLDRVEDETQGSGGTEVKRANEAKGQEPANSE
jgi:hypothetical protein